MLNDYHRQFLRHLIRTKCRFLLIGGQARCLQVGGLTRDLDILVDIGADNRQPLEFSLRFWKSIHPLHSMLDFEGPINLAPKMQIEFPDGDGCGYVSTLGLVTILDIADGIDILTSLEGFEFEDLYCRSVPWDFEGSEQRMLSDQDLLKTSSNSIPKS